MLGGTLEVVCSSIGPAWDAPFWSVEGSRGGSREMINGSAVATGDGFFNSFAPKEDFFSIGAHPYTEEKREDPFILRRKDLSGYHCSRIFFSQTTLIRNTCFYL